MSSADEASSARAETYAEFAALVGALAHEIRNPLNAMLGAIQVGPSF